MSAAGHAVAVSIAGEDGAAAAEDSARQGAHDFEPNIAADPNVAPDSEEPIEPPSPPQLIVPAPGVDAGVSDHGGARRSAG